jgi:hypothetical protein
MNRLEQVAEAIAAETLWTPTEALAILKLSHLGVRAEDVIRPWKDYL